MENLDGRRLRSRGKETRLKGCGLEKVIVGRLRKKKPGVKYADRNCRQVTREEKRSKRGQEEMIAAREKKAE